MLAKKLNPSAGREKEAPVAKKKRTAIPKTGRSRPGRRTNEERKVAVLELLAGKATVDQLAQRYGVLPETVEGWRTAALEGIEESLRFGPSGPGKSQREKELERELKDARHAVTESAIQVALLQRAAKEWGFPVPAQSGISGSTLTRGKRP